MVRSIINRLLKPDLSRSEAKPIISRRFIIGVSITYSALILVTAGSFFIATRIMGETLRDAIEMNKKELLLGKTELLIDRLRAKALTSPQTFIDAIMEDSAGIDDILAAVLFTRTEDENYYRVGAIGVFTEGFSLPIRVSEVVRPGKEVNYVKTGSIQPVVDPEIHVRDAFAWQNAYAPIKMERRNAVLQIYYSASRTQMLLEEYRSAMRLPRGIMLGFTIFCIAAVGIITAVFMYNYSYLIRNLSAYMKKAAEGDLDVSLRKTDDRELNLLAESFNTLIDELRDRSEKTSEEAKGMAPIFAAGVSLLKDNRLDEAIAVFRALTILNRNSFGSYFNLGVAYAKKREYQSAIEMFQTAERLNPGFEMSSRYIEKIRDLIGDNV